MNFGLDYWSEWDPSNAENCTPDRVDVIVIDPLTPATTGLCIQIPVTCGNVALALQDPDVIADDGRDDCRPFFDGELSPCGP